MMAKPLLKAGGNANSDFRNTMKREKAKRLCLPSATQEGSVKNTYFSESRLSNKGLGNDDPDIVGVAVLGRLDTEGLTPS